MLEGMWQRMEARRQAGKTDINLQYPAKQVC
jgi:hypothetical protein